MMTQDRLRAGLAYEMSNGCANAKGKAFDDFQSFLTASLRELERSHASPMLAHMVRDSTVYGNLDVDRRQRLLQNMSTALPGVIQRGETAPDAARVAADAASVVAAERCAGGRARGGRRR